MSRYIQTNFAVERLFKEYLKYKRLIIAVDFDETVFPFDGHNDDYELVFSSLRKCKEFDFFISAFTASNQDRWQFIEEYFRKNGIVIDSINKNPIELLYGNWGKMYYNILLDDRAGLGQSLEILNKTLEKIENYNKNI